MFGEDMCGIFFGRGMNLHIFSPYVVTFYKACCVELSSYTALLHILPSDPHLLSGSHSQSEVPWGIKDETVASLRSPAQPRLCFGGGRNGGRVLG